MPLLFLLFFASLDRQDPNQPDGGHHNRDDTANHVLMHTFAPSVKVWLFDYLVAAPSGNRNIQPLAFLSRLPGALRLQIPPMNEFIQEAREQALRLLQPSKKDLDHGLELHAQSLVVESYGFSPCAAIDGD